MYIVWLFNPQGFSRDYKFDTWHEAMAFMVFVDNSSKTRLGHIVKDEYIRACVEWELTCHANS